MKEMPRNWIQVSLGMETWKDLQKDYDINCWFYGHNCTVDLEWKNYSEIRTAVEEKRFLSIRVK